MDKDHAELFEIITLCDEERNSNPALCKMRAYFKLHFEAEEVGSTGSSVTYKAHYSATARSPAVPVPRLEEGGVDANHLCYAQCR